MSELSDILVRVGADVDPLKKGFKDAGAESVKLKSKVMDAAKATVAIGAAATAAGLAIGVSLVANSMSAVDAQAKLATQLKTTSKSIANLELAADLSGISMQQVSGAAKALNVRLAEAAGGTGEAVSALEKMGITTKQLEGMALDKKIGFLNDAIKNNVAVSEQAAVAADLYGARAGAAIATMDSAAIEGASENIERFGLAISDIDAAKIEAANDAITLAKKSTTGLAQQMAVQLSPVIGAVADKFTEIRGETSLMQDASKKAFGFMVKAVGFTQDSIRGLHVVIKALELGFNALGVGIFAVLEAIPKTVDMIINSAKSSVNGLIDGMNHLPGVDISTLVIGQSKASGLMEDFRVSAVAEFAETKAELDALASKPMPSTIWEKFVEDAQSASTEAAKAVVTARQNAFDLPIVSDPKNDPLVTYTDKTIEELTAMYSRAGMARIDSEKANNDDAIKSQKAFGSESLSAYSTLFGNVSSLMESSNKTQFEIGKKAAAAQTIVDTYASAQSAFKSLAGIPVVGPALGAAAAGAAVVAGMARLSAINSTSFNSSSASPAVGSSSTTAAQAGQGGSAAGSNSTLFVENINPDSLFTGSTVRSLAGQLLQYQRDGGEVVLV